MIDKLNVLDAVIGLPANLFHGTSIPVCCLVLKKKRNGNSNNIFFIDASKEFVPDKQMNAMSDEHIDKIVNAYIERKDIDKYAHVADMDEIKENGLNLNIPRYVDTSEEVPEVDLNAVATEIKSIDAAIDSVSEELKKSFAQLGLEFPF